MAKVLGGEHACRWKMWSSPQSVPTGSPAERAGAARGAQQGGGLGGDQGVAGEDAKVR